MSARPLAVFRCDAGPDIGGGHAVRCIALAIALREAGWRTAFASRPGTAATVPAIAEFGTEGLMLDCDEAGEPASLAQRWPGGAALLVVDHYGRDAAFERACRPWADRILVIDDLADRRHDCDLHLDQNLGTTEEDYAGLVPETCRLLIGPQYALLRPQFSAIRKVALARRESGAEISSILVSLGSSDPVNATCEAIRAIDESGLGVRTKVVLGAAAPHLATVRARAAAARVPIDVHTEVPDMAAMMAAADIAIGAAGVSSWERCCLGLPSLLIVIADNQKKVARALQASGAARVIGRHDVTEASRIGDALAILVADRAWRRAMSEAAAAVCDGRGGLRTALALQPAAAARDGTPVTLRLAAMSDSQRILDWQRHPDTRRYFHNPRLPDPKTHEAWLGSRVENPGHLPMIVLHGGEPAGFVRLEPTDEEGVLLVSILVAPDRYRLGLGKAALGLARQIRPDAQLLAEVLPGNAASHALFSGAGYARVDECLYATPPAAASQSGARSAIAPRPA